MTTRREFLRDATLGVAGVGLGATLPGALAAATGASVRSVPLKVHRSEQVATGTGLFYDPACLEHVVPAASSGAPRPEIAERLVRIMQVMNERGLVDDMRPLSAHADPMPYIAAHHTAEHVAGIRRIPVTGPLAELAVAGALGAVDAVVGGEVRNAFCAVRPPGHHANNTGEEEGFCYYSNAAITARYAQRAHGFERVLIIDWDYHHGNATQNAFFEDPSVLFYSTHDWQAYPQTGDPALVGEGEGRGTNINVHLDCGSRDLDMLRAWDQRLERAVSDFDPDFIIVSAGFDSRQDDLLGCFDVTDDAFRRMTRSAMAFADSCCEGRLVSLLEGGYNVDGLALATAAHVETLLSG
ncbi:MAG: histone deacetylase [Gemmatimonadota bacterium]|nr:histone deacetylase [Gemmatimonadota bacterium]MDH3424665.1 histone deacetylase [Gemmatimonadota bacterium]